MPKKVLPGTLSTLATKALLDYTSRISNNRKTVCQIAKTIVSFHEDSSLCIFCFKHSTGYQPILLPQVVCQNIIEAYLKSYDDEIVDPFQYFMFLHPESISVAIKNIDEKTVQDFDKLQKRFTKVKVLNMTNSSKERRPNSINTFLSKVLTGLTLIKLEINSASEETLDILSQNCNRLKYLRISGILTGRNGIRYLCGDEGRLGCLDLEYIHINSEHKYDPEHGYVSFSVGDEVLRLRKLSTLKIPNASIFAIVPQNEPVAPRRAITELELENIFEISNFVAMFPNLCKLKTTHFGTLRNVDQIKELKLTELSISGIIFNFSESIKELTLNLTKLKVCTANNMDLSLIIKNGTLLEELDLRGDIFTSNKIFLKSRTNIKKIFLSQTSGSDITASVENILVNSPNIEEIILGLNGETGRDVVEKAIRCHGFKELKEIQIIGDSVCKPSTLLNLLKLDNPLHDIRLRFFPIISSEKRQLLEYILKNNLNVNLIFL